MAPPPQLVLQAACAGLRQQARLQALCCWAGFLPHSSQLVQWQVVVWGLLLMHHAAWACMCMCMYMCGCLAY